MKMLRRIAGFVCATLAAALVAGAVRACMGLLSGTDAPKFDIWSDMMWVPILLAGIELPMTAIAFGIALSLMATLSTVAKNLPQPWVLTAIFSVVSLTVIAWRSSNPWSGVVPFSAFDAYAQSWSNGSALRAIVAGSKVAGGFAAATIWAWFTRDRVNV
jgi:hypothetical protein